MAKEKEKKEKKYFFRDFKAELKKVIWPTPKQLLNSTIAVITIVLITAVIVLVLDLIFENVNKFGVNRIKSIVSTSENTTIDDSTESEDTVTEEDTITEENTEIDENIIEDTNTIQE